MSNDIVAVTQDDREAAAAVRPYSHNSALILDGQRDGTDIVQAAARARIRLSTPAIDASHPDDQNKDAVLSIMRDLKLPEAIDASRVERLRELARAGWYKPGDHPIISTAADGWIKEVSSLILAALPVADTGGER